MDSKTYAEQLEKKLIDQFRENFFEKLGYYPTVMTGAKVSSDIVIPFMHLSTLKECFDPFLPEIGGFTYNLDSRSRCRELVELRSIYCYLGRQMRYSLDTIGKSVGDRDHTTVINSLRNFNDLMDTDEQFRQKYSAIVTYIKKVYESSVMAKLDQIQRESEPAVLPGLMPIQDQAHQYH
jgi:hypothetical protein